MTSFGTAVAAATTDLSDVVAERLNRHGTTGAAERLVDRLAEPNTLAALTRLAERAELLAFLADSLDGFLRRADEVAEAVAEGARDLGAGGGGGAGLGETVAALPRLAQALAGAVKDGTVEAMGTVAHAAVPVVESGMLEPRLVGTLAQAGATLADAYREASEQPPRRLSALGLVRALRDPDVARGVGFAVEIARQLGRRLPAT